MLFPLPTLSTTLQWEVFSWFADAVVHRGDCQTLRTPPPTPAHVSSALLITITARTAPRALTITMSHPHSSQDVLIILKNLLCARHHSIYLKFIREQNSKHFCTQRAFLLVHKGFCPLTLLKIFQKPKSAEIWTSCFYRWRNSAVWLLVSLNTSAYPQVTLLVNLVPNVFLGFSLPIFMPTHWFYFHCWPLSVSGRINDPEWTWVQMHSSPVTSWVIMVKSLYSNFLISKIAQ